MSEITIEVPDEKQPGYLRRLIAVSRFQELQREGKITPEYYDNLITFILAYVSEPEDRDEAREALLDASAEQYMDILSAITGKDENPTPPEPSEKS